jgi:hypothetical protein
MLYNKRAIESPTLVIPGVILGLHIRNHANELTSLTT